jgi:hypothetical protein
VDNTFGDEPLEIASSNSDAIFESLLVDVGVGHNGASCLRTPT